MAADVYESEGENFTPMDLMGAARGGRVGRTRIHSAHSISKYE
jgi:hypothetical protein